MAKVVGLTVLSECHLYQVRVQGRFLQPQCPHLLRVSVVEHVRITMLTLNFQPFRFGDYKWQDDHLLAALRDIAVDPRQCSSG